MHLLLRFSGLFCVERTVCKLGRIRSVLWKAEKEIDPGWALLQAGHQFKTLRGHCHTGVDPEKFMQTKKPSVLGNIKEIVEKAVHKK